MAATIITGRASSGRLNWNASAPSPMSASSGPTMAPNDTNIAATLSTPARMPRVAT